MYFSSGVRLFALLLLLSPSAAVSVAAQGTTALLDKALADGRAGRFDECVAEFTELIERLPKVPGAAGFYVGRADAYVHGGHYDKAWPDLTEAVALDPKVEKAYYLQGFILDTRRDRTGAIAAYTKALALDPKDEDSLYNRGSDLSVTGQQAAAIADYTRAIELDGQDASYYLNRGAAFAAQGKDAAAFADFAKAIDLKPHEMKAYVDRAALYLRRHMWAQAIKACEEAPRMRDNPQLVEILAEAKSKLH